MPDTSIFGNRARIARIPVAAALALVLLLAPFAGATAQAAGGLNLSTPYPGVTVSPGEDVTFKMTVENEAASPQNVQLSAEAPEGWRAYFEGGGNPVSRVYVNDADSDANTVTVDLVVKIPDGVKEGTYTILARAAGSGGAADTLQLDVTVATEEFTKGKLTAQYQEQEGSSSTIFSYSMTLTNGSGTPQSYSLNALVPTGWQTKFTNAEGLQIASLNLEAGRSQTITVTLDPPTDVAAGSYAIPVTAVSANEELSVQFAVVITGTYAMTLSTPSGAVSLTAVAGKDSTVTLTIENTGTADLDAVSLATTNVPTGWTVTFDMDKIERLPAGETAQVVATIAPASDAINGDYVVALRVRTDQATSSAEFRVTVETSSVWGIVGIAIVAAVVAALVLVFRKFGRR